VVPSNRKPWSPWTGARKKLAQACETTAANTVAAAPEPDLIHPGVAKYFREIGVMK
jgi:uncharacterized protein